MKKKLIYGIVLASALLVGLQHVSILAAEEDTVIELNDEEQDIIQKMEEDTELVESEVETEYEELVIDEELAEESRNCDEESELNQENEEAKYTKGEIAGGTWNLDEAGVLTITGYTEMPQWNNEKEVTWYSMRQDIQKIIIEGVTTIGDYAFCDCVNVEEVEIPDSVTRIGKNAFYNCNGLTKMDIG